MIESRICLGLAAALDYPVVYLSVEHALSVCDDPELSAVHSQYRWLAAFLQSSWILAVTGTSVFLSAHAAGRTLAETRGTFVAAAPSPIVSSAGHELYVVADRGLDERAYLSADSDENCAFGKVGEHAEKHRMYLPW